MISSLNWALTCIGREHMWVRTSFLAVEYSSSPTVAIRLFCMLEKQNKQNLLFSLFNRLNKPANISKSNKKKELLCNKRSTDIQSSCWGQIDVDSQLVAELLQLIHHFGFGWRVAPEQSQLREFLIDVVCCGDVSQQHELLHQPAEQCEVVKQCRLTVFLFHLFMSQKDFFSNIWFGSSSYSLVTISVLVNIAALRHHGLFVQSERQFQLKTNKQNKAMFR